MNEASTAVTILKAAGGVTSTIGFLTSVVSLWMFFVARQQEVALQRRIVGDPTIPPAQVLLVLREFKDDAARLKALKLIVGGGEAIALAMLERAKTYDPARVLAEQRAGLTRQIAIVGGLALAFGVLAFAAGKVRSQGIAQVVTAPDAGVSAAAARQQQPSVNVTAVGEHPTAVGVLTGDIVYNQTAHDATHDAQ